MDAELNVLVVVKATMSLMEAQELEASLVTGKPSRASSNLLSALSTQLLVAQSALREGVSL
jgi:hypothetical protein